ncbi:BlaI/MecI/CopY family transcriptional regulator [Conexibacter sp. W3-3-2]|uniref:BlaI/MecI/CopY family transcriptional regulator n=1 Tax=Conexibacter sp. W3-3-2 TaxID=2675227 RepID=UPI0012B6CBE7|nr:BlaI/MecI/CopY family transcriptional regulator [Conexibacter sp. W3-3-2]MTD43675.1 BlaI/MecI/CopY family transcriptional regulator [Conexibacter sp. W3-3-2]
MSAMSPLQGDLQVQVMAVMWRRDEATVDDVRQGLPPRYRGAYTTVQTVLNRLVERGLLKRRKAGKLVQYRAAISEATYVASTVEHALAGASSGARDAVLAQLLGSMDDDQVDELRRLRKDLDEKRR